MKKPPLTMPAKLNSVYEKVESRKAQYNQSVVEEAALIYDLPGINFTHFKNLTSDFGIREFSSGNGRGYTLNDNATALIIQCAKYESEKHQTDIQYIKTYLDFIQHCFQPEGYFLNYVDEKGHFTKQNDSCNLADINGKAVWALGRLISLSPGLPAEIIEAAEIIMKRMLFKINTIYSKRAMAYTIKGLYYYNLEKKSDEVFMVIKGMANRLEQMYKHSAENSWKWFEGFVEPGDCVLSEALLYAYSATGEILYKEISKSSFDFLLSCAFDKNDALINFHSKEYNQADRTSAQQIYSTDLSHIILALGSFYKEFNHSRYLSKMKKAFNLFSNYTSAAEEETKPDQSTLTTVNYLHSRLIMEKCLKSSTAG